MNRFGPFSITAIAGVSESIFGDDMMWWRASAPGIDAVHTWRNGESELRLERASKSNHLISPEPSNEDQYVSATAQRLIVATVPRMTINGTVHRDRSRLLPLKQIRMHSRPRKYQQQWPQCPNGDHRKGCRPARLTNQNPTERRPSISHTDPLPIERLIVAADWKTHRSPRAH
jgi:hypothetical protein